LQNNNIEQITVGSSSTSALDDATVHCRRPSVSRRRGTNMEQFASRSDVIKFPANL